MTEPTLPEGFIVKNIFSLRFLRILKGSIFLGPLVFLGLLAAKGNLSEYVEKETIRDILLLVFQWGPALLIMGGLFELIRSYFPQFIEAQREQASAMALMAASVKEIAEQDSDDRREILINLRVLATKIDELKDIRHV